MSERSYCIIGTGALGGYYGARLHHSGCDVGFLLHSDFDHVRSHGLTVESRHGDFSIDRPRIYQSPADVEPADVAIVSLKTTHNHLLPQILTHVVKKDGAVLVMQNGLGVEDEVAAIVGHDRVLGGLAFLCSHKVGPGHIRHLDYGQVRLGQWNADEQPAGVTALVQAIGSDLERSGIPVELEADLLLARWKKLVWNVPYNGLSVVLGATTDQLMGNPDTRQLCIDLMWEVVRGARTMGREIGEDLVEQMIRYTDKMVAYKPSMLLDAEHNRPLEIEAIYGMPMRIACARGQRLVRTELLYHWLKANF